MWLFSLFLALAAAKPIDRLSLIHKDLSRSDQIYLSKGLASVIEFPKPIIEVRVGNPSILSPAISQVSPRELTLFLNSDTQGPTNIIVRADKRIYVFDIVPSHSNHQDFIKVSGGYGAPSSTPLAFGQAERVSIDFAPRKKPVHGKLIVSAKVQ